MTTKPNTQYEVRKGFRSSKKFLTKSQVAALVSDGYIVTPVELLAGAGRVIDNYESVLASGLSKGHIRGFENIKAVRKWHGRTKCVPHQIKTHVRFVKDDNVYYYPRYTEVAV
jgi:hypothetical protein